MSDLEFNKENFEKSKQRVINVLVHIIYWTKDWGHLKKEYGENDLWFWHLMDFCLFMLEPFNFRVSEDDIHNAVNSVGYKYINKNSMARFLWEGTLRGKEYGWQTCSSLDNYMDFYQFFTPPFGDKRGFFKWPKVKEHLKFIANQDHNVLDGFIVFSRCSPKILKKAFQLSWWLGKELEKIEKEEK